MKKYKVGDTIYIKDTVTDIDCDDSMATYYGNHHGWLDNSCIIDELPAEPVKPILPKKVADELERAKKSRFSFDGYIMRVIDGHPGYTNSCAFWNSSDNSATKTLMDAWYNGYTVKEEKQYNVKVPHTEDVWYYKIYDGNLMTISGKKLRSDFTEEEIEHYGLQDCDKVEAVNDGN